MGWSDGCLLNQILMQHSHYASPLSSSYERSGNEDELAGFCLRWSWNLDPSPHEAAQDDIHWIR